MSYLLSWLLEVNASPSLIASSQEDYELKCHLLKDTLHIVDMEGRWAKKLMTFSGFLLTCGMGGLVLSCQFLASDCNALSFVTVK